MVLSSVGLLFYLRDTVDIAFTYPMYPSTSPLLIYIPYHVLIHNRYNKKVSATYMYYLIAVPFHFIPVIVRSWYFLYFSILISLSSRTSSIIDLSILLPHLSSLVFCSSTCYSFTVLSLPLSVSESITCLEMKLII